MILYHQYLIKYLPYNILLDLHRRCCVLRESSWKKKDGYIKKYPYNYLFAYHFTVLETLRNRMNSGNSSHEWTFEYEWAIHNYRGEKKMYSDPTSPFMKKGWREVTRFINDFKYSQKELSPLYKEHDNKLLKKQLLTLSKNNIKLVGTIIEKELIKLDLII